MAIGISAISISIISLFVAISHGKTEERLVAASSWPFLIFQSSENGFGSDFHFLSLRLQNSGIGPARVRSFRMLFDGKPMHNHSEFMARCCGVNKFSDEDQFKQGLVSENDAVGVLPARDGVNFLAWRVIRGHETVWNNLKAARRKLRFKACYCSVLDECWTSDLTPNSNPRRINQCPIDADGYAG